MHQDCTASAVCSQVCVGLECISLRAVVRSALAQCPWTPVTPALAGGSVIVWDVGWTCSCPIACLQRTTAWAGCTVSCWIMSLNDHVLNRAAPSGRSSEAAGFHGLSPLVQLAVSCQQGLNESSLDKTPRLVLFLLDF